MSEQTNAKRSKEELLQWFEDRRKHLLIVDSEEFEGMSICYANPELVPDEDEVECEQDKRNETGVVNLSVDDSHPA